MSDSRLKLVGKIKFKDENDRTLQGTGFLVDKNIVITVFHNIKYLELNKHWEIKFKIDGEEEICLVDEVIKSNKYLDIAILKINKSLVRDHYFKMVDFPLLNEFNLLKEKIEVNVIGYRAATNNPELFLAEIIQSNQDDTIMVSYIRGMNDESQGLSGAPIVISGSLYVYGMAIKQIDPLAGQHINSIINDSIDLRDFFDGTSVEFKKFDNYKLIDKEGYKEKLLNEVESNISERYIMHEIVRNRINRESKHIIDDLRSMNADNFEEFINLISIHDGNKIKNKFTLSSNYKTYIKGIADIICHISVLACKYKLKSLNLETLKPIKLTEKKYLSYAYSFNHSSYTASIIQIFKYIEENIEFSLNGISDILIGHENCDCDCSGCKKPFLGASIDFDFIIKNICHTQGYDEDEKNLLKITDIESDFKNLNFHCKKCLNFDVQTDISKIKDNVKNVLGE